MGEIHENPLPGTAATQVEEGEMGFRKIEILLEATGGLSLSQVCSVTGLEGTTIQNWVKRGWVAHPKGKKYEERHIARILIINALKDCIKLEHIALLMTYINGETEASRDDIIRESMLYDYLCEALQKLGQADDLSRGGVESVVERVIVDYEGPTPLAHVKVRKALTVMIFACVCTNVKRRTEAMMQQVLIELENPESLTVENLAGGESYHEEPVAELTQPVGQVSRENRPAADETRKTVAQAIREWDMSRVEDILQEENDSEEESAAQESSANDGADTRKTADSNEKPAQKPWYFRRN